MALPDTIWYPPRTKHERPSLNENFDHFYLVRRLRMPLEALELTDKDSGHSTEVPRFSQRDVYTEFSELERTAEALS